MISADLSPGNAPHCGLLIHAPIDNLCHFFFPLIRRSEKSGSYLHMSSQSVPCPCYDQNSLSHEVKNRPHLRESVLNECPCFCLSVVDARIQSHSPVIAKRQSAFMHFIAFERRAPGFLIVCASSRIITLMYTAVVVRIRVDSISIVAQSGHTRTP